MNVDGWASTNSAQRGDFMPSENYFKGLKDGIDAAIHIIEKHVNPRPPELYAWDNTEQINMTEGQFNQHIYYFIEDFRKYIIDDLKEQKEVV